MKKKLPFEEAIENKLQQIPQPGEETSWQAMEQLLEKDDRKRGLFFGRKKYVFLVGVALLLSLIVWQLFYNDSDTIKRPDNKNTVALSKQKNNPADAGKGLAANTRSPQQDIDSSQPGDIKSTNKQNDNKKYVESPSVLKNHVKTNNTTPVNEKSNVATYNASPGTRKENRYRQSSTVIATKTRATRHNKAKKSTVAQNDLGDSDIFKANKNKLNSKGKSRIQVSAPPMDINTVNDSNHIVKLTLTDNDIKKEEKIATDIPGKSLTETKDVKNIADSSSKKQEVISLSKTSDENKKKLKKFMFNAGIGLKQQIPIGNQQLYTYGFNGRTNIINDYVPSAYMSFGKTKKWFALLEFDFASSRMMKEFPYSRTTTLNNSSNQLFITTMQLKKTFYHELGLSYNYYIKPRWSVGVGVSWNKLYRSISEEQLSVKNIQSQEEQTSFKILPAGYTNSFLYKTTTGWMLQTNYEWRRLSFGIRWSADMQPYIKYTKPSGEIKDHRNQSLDLVLKIRLWKAGIPRKGSQ